MRDEREREERERGEREERGERGERERERERRERERALYLMVLPQSCWVRDLAWNRDIWPACLCCWDDAWTQLWRWTTAWRSVLNSRGPAVLQTCHPPARSKSHLEGDTCYSQYITGTGENMNISYLRVGVNYSDNPHLQAKLIMLIEWE